jgi:NtrC-family two-component system response regulator AlgB
MAMKASVLLVDDEQNILKTVKICLESAGFMVDAYAEPLKALDAVREHSYDLAFFDLKMTPMDGIELLKETRRLSPHTSVILMTAHGTINSAVEAMKVGATDYLQKPFEFSELRHFAEKVFEHHRLAHEVRVLREELENQRGTGEIITRSAQMKQIVDLAVRVAPSSMAVLIEGESGTGKELLARLIHDKSDRADEPFIHVNCAALAENLLESELFGHVRGAFTGATKDREGRFEAAERGTVFLDEIGEISPAVQAKLLRVLQSKEFERVGESVTRKADVRVIAATNRNIEQEVQEGKFREDLFYRLNAMRLRLPPLRDRIEDVPLLVQYFIRKFNAQVEVSPEVMSVLTKYAWKGNIRELENVIERAVLLSQGSAILIHHLPEEFQTLVDSGKTTLSLEEMERQHIIKVLRVSKDLDEAASVLGIDPATLWRKRKKYNL